MSSKKRAVEFRHADGPAGTAVAWTTPHLGRVAVRAWQSTPNAHPITLDASGASPQIAWTHRHFAVAWDHQADPRVPNDHNAVRIARLHPRRGVVGVSEAPLNLNDGAWSNTRSMHSTPCGVVIHTRACRALSQQSWLWFVRWHALR